MFNQFFGEEGVKRVTRWTTVVLVVFSVFLLVKVIGDFKRLPNVGREVYPQSTITVSGKGEAFAIPDIASFSFSVTEASESVESAQDMLNEKVSKALSALKESNVDEKDIKTVGYNVYPKYDWEQIYCVTYPCPQGKNKLIGYEVSQTVMVKVRDVEKVGDLVSKVGAINISNISGVEFTVDDREFYVAKAREEAIADAKDKAKELAKQLGVKLGKIMYFNENGNYQPYYGEGMGGGKDMMLSAEAVKAEIPQGETKITSDISITYEIK